MIDSSFSELSVKFSDATPETSTSEVSTSKTQAWISRFVLLLAGFTLFLMALGSATRVMNAGLSCPDWPLCYGELVPAAEMNLQVFLEWFHRLIATVIGFASIVLVGVTIWKRRELPPWAPILAGLAFGLVVFQGILGGLTVTELLRFDIVTAHLGTGLLFFTTLLTLGLLLKPDIVPQSGHKPGSLSWLGLAAAGLVYLQSLLGGLVASQWALHQCFASGELCLVMNGHLIGIIPATAVTLALVVMVWIRELTPQLKRLGYLAGGLVIAQIALGTLTFKLHLQVEPLTVAHQAVGAVLLGTLVAFTVFSLKENGWLAPSPADTTVKAKA